MLIVKEDKNRQYPQGQIFVELTDSRDIRNLSDCNRLGYWCDKPHLRHFLLEIAKVFTTEELEGTLNCKIIKP